MQFRSLVAVIGLLQIRAISADGGEGRLDYVVRSGEYTQMMKPFQCHQLEHPGPVYKVTGNGPAVEFYPDDDCQGSKTVLYATGSVTSTEFFDPPLDVKSVKWSTASNL